MPLARIAGLVLYLLPALALAHSERPIASPPRPGQVPDLNRKSAHTLVVCKPSSRPTQAEHDEIHQLLATATGDALALAQAREAAWHRNAALFGRCRYEHIQEAVNAAADDTDILVMPGVYREEPSRAAPDIATGNGPNGTFLYEDHLANPNAINLIAILGKKNITLEGTGVNPPDVLDPASVASVVQDIVLIDTGFAKDVGIRCDRCGSVIFRNFWQRDAREHGVYTVDSDGYFYKNVIGSFNHEYELFSFASDHGVYEDCEAVGGSDSGLYIGGAPNTPGRESAVARRVKMHHNALGFSGTQGNYVRLEQNDVYDNSVGISFDTEQDHPNPPMNNCMIVDNDIHDNNFDIYAQNSDVPPGGPAYSTLHYPVGTGLWVVGGNDCRVSQNRIWNNNCFGAMLFENPIEMATISGNQHTNNVIGAAVPGGGPNGTSCNAPPADLWWDGTGTNNCWQDNGTVTTSPASLPDCSTPNAGAGDPINELLLASCLITDGSTGQTAGSCAFCQTNQCPYQYPAPYQSRDQAECGNGRVDLGEDCDPGHGGGRLPADETCASLGHGPGTLACNALCTWDTSGCAAPAVCDEYGTSVTRLQNVSAPGGDDVLRFVARDLPGHVFDPRMEEFGLVVRDDSALVHEAVIPTGNSSWTAIGASAYKYSDPAGTFDGITQVRLRAKPTFAKAFVAKVRIRGASLAAAAGARTATTVLRVGDDCWSDTTACLAGGGNVICRGRSQP